MIKSLRYFPELSDDIVLWHYMSLDKFSFLIENKKLHFHRIDDFDDKGEGNLSDLDKRDLPFQVSDEYVEKDRKRYFVNCWVESNDEQQYMWENYGNNGVAIITTVGAIKKAMSNELSFYIHPVRYVDREKDSAQITGTNINWFRYSFTKSIQYEQEKEVRLLYVDEDGEYSSKGKNIKGINVDVDIKELIKSIRVNPNASTYMVDIVSQELKKSGLETRLKAIKG